MAEGLRERRIRNEAAMLAELAALNGERLKVLSRGADEFQMALKTSAYLAGADQPGEWTLTLRIVFAPYYPAVPIEVYVHPGVRHPNVHPVSGFICLWAKHSSGDTVIEALRQTQRVLSWQLFNEEADHRMQSWPENFKGLEFDPLLLPEGYLLERETRGFTGAKRKRLTEVE
jgi:ubiquitin-protein ligase